MKALPAGKIPISVLNSTVLKFTGASSGMVATPPLAGLDFAAVRVGREFMIVSADPVTGVVEEIGRYAVNVSANDVATSGSRPQFAESIVLLPEGADAAYVKKIATQLDSEAKRLGISIVGGHTEVTPGLGRPIVMVTAFCFTKSFVSSANAKEGDTMMLTKTAGLEGTAVLGGSEKFLSNISVVDEAVDAYGTGCVHAMHDCTEGGVLGAAFEMSLASKLGFEMHEKKVPVAAETKRLCRKLAIDPLRLIGSGALLLAVEPGGEAEVAKALASTCRVTVVGRFSHGRRTLVRAGGKREKVSTAPEDELWRVVSRPSGSGHWP